MTAPRWYRSRKAEIFLFLFPKLSSGNKITVLPLFAKFLIHFIFKLLEIQVERLFKGPRRSLIF